MNIFGLGTPELILILVVFLLFFGKNKLPELAKNIGISFNALKEGFNEAGESSNTQATVSEASQKTQKAKSKK